MKNIFSKKNIIRSIISPYDNYCVGYPGAGNYLTALMIDIGISKKRFTHEGSDLLDSIIAYDKAEVSDTYIGQINMIMVSSFCGPHGLIWGYDIAKEDSVDISSIISSKSLSDFKNIKIKNGKNLRIAANNLFGTISKKHFPLIPGGHVPCAGKFYTKSGPALLYGAIAIGIADDREKNACVLMEDVGEIVAKQKDKVDLMKEKIISNNIHSVIEIGKTQKVKYKEIFVDFAMKEVCRGEIGCVLVAMPYLHLAKKAFNTRIDGQSLEEWKAKSKKYFLDK